ncbi:hypothetical protein OG589_17660 [Sphaerisporangium sp. NBC_01403]|uniref:hypothetical protein n=1 Tax=Sphaerisporangium TaxID=321315 RepID=UPI003251258B
MSVTEQSLGQLFWSAAQSEPLPTAKAEAKSSCCGPKPAAETKAAPAAKSSCCGPKPAEDAAKDAESAPVAKSSCCG